MLAKLKLFGISKDMPLYRQLTALFEREIHDLYSLHEAALPFPGALNWIYSHANVDLCEGQLSFPPAMVRNHRIHVVHLRLLQLGRQIWPIRRRMTAFMYGLRKRGFYRDLRLVLFHFLRTLYMDFAHIYRLMCGTYDYEMRELTAPFLLIKKSNPVRRIQQAAYECIRCGFDNIDFQTHIERQALKTENWDALYWFNRRLHGQIKTYNGSESSVLRLQRLGPYFCELARRHTQVLADSNIFCCYGAFPKVVLHDDTFAVCLELSRLTFQSTFRSKYLLRLELQGTDFMSLLEQYPFFEKFKECAIGAGL